MSSMLLASVDFVADLGLLTHLDLTGTRVSDLSPLAVACPLLEKLDLSGCPVTDVSPLNQLKARRLSTLLLSSTPISDLSPLSSMSSLRHLCACRSHVSDLTPLASCSCLEILCLNHVKSLTSLDGVSECPLKCLRVGNTNVTALPPAPAAWRGLRELELYDAPISEDSLGSLSSTIFQLQHLNLSGLRILQLRFSSCSQLTSLEVSRTELGTGEILIECHLLESLVVDACQLSSLAFLPTLPHLKYLSMTEVVTITVFSPLSGCLGLRKLDLSRTRLRTLETFSSPRLVTLLVQSCDLTSLAGIEKFPDLVHLDVSLNEITSLEPCSQLRKLESLHACCVPVRQIPRLDQPKFRQLCLAHSPVESLLPLIHCRDLVSLNITGSAIMDLGMVRFLRGLTTLVALHTPISSLEPLRGHPGLRDLCVSHSQVDDVQVLPTLERLAEVSLCGCPVHDLSALQSCASLQSVSLDARHHSHPALQSLFETSCAIIFQ